MYVIKMVGIDKFKISVDCVVVSTYLLYKGCCVFLASHHPCILIGVGVAWMSIPLF